MGRILKIKFISGPIKGQVFTFDEEPEIIIGRLDSCDITLKDPKISSEHCGIFFEDGEYILEDFESTNGTYVNTTKVDEEDYILEGGETLFLGSSKAIVQIQDSKPSRKPSSKPKHEDNFEDDFDDDIDDINNIDDLDDFEDEDTGIKKINQYRGFKKFFDIDYYLDLKDRFMALEPKKRIIVALAVFVFLFVGFSVISSLTSKNGKTFFRRSWSDESEKLLDLNDNVLDKLLGYMKSPSGKEDFSHPKKVRFKFIASNEEKIVIEYYVTKIEYLDELVVMLNGVKIATAPLTSDEVMNVKLSLPFENLYAGKENILEFINTKNLGAKKYKNWGMLISKIDKRLLPKPDFDKAKENYIKGEKFYDQKKISRGNRYKAYKYYQTAIDFMELMKDKPDFYYDAKEKIKMIEKEFDEIYQNNRYAALRAFKFQKYEEAKLYINNIIEEIPDEEDSRYKTALKMLNAIP